MGRAPVLRDADAGALHENIEAERIGQLLGVVLTCLLETFPRDFFRRCAFSAYAIRALLARDGVGSHAVGGRFTSLVVSRHGDRYALQGFESGPERFPHLWVATANRIIDLGPYFLPWGSPFPLQLMPPLVWSRSEPLPKGLHYEVIEVLSDNATFSSDPDVQRQADEFVSRCLAAAPTSVPFPYWLATGQAALIHADAAGDAWVKGLVQFERAPDGTDAQRQS
ncbi:hypothetical protein HJG53_01065 [Sphingomonas sp. ID1715]|uniref:hypothetical protein n=1 Tax=Sphingomonas sp. ID1715 TaxID=1656898 RepID=UPI001489A338|nr:hypothetical protein [Sphingomonas sp. ID1715]NNM75499.1 hypothetical protein [Sphingomonas sp. ID1715]